jgi:hypothetical protein
MQDDIDSARRRIAAAQNTALARGKLNIWTVYDHPKDFPQGYIARRFEIGHGPLPIVTDDTVKGSLSVIRESFELCGLYRLSCNVSDEPHIIETWL